MITLTETIATTNTTGLLNRSAIKKLALKLSRDTRAGKITRVSKGWLEKINSMVEAKIRSEVSAHRVGKTLM